MTDKAKKPVEPPKKNSAARLREKATSTKEEIPQGIRNQLLDSANEQEFKAYEKTKKYASGGSVRGYGAAMRGRGRGKLC